MKQNEKKEKDWPKEESWQIAVYKTDKALLELCDNLKPSSRLFPAPGSSRPTSMRPEKSQREGNAP